MPARSLVALETKFICPLHEGANEIEFLGRWWGSAPPKVFPHQKPDTAQSFGETSFAEDSERAQPGDAI